MNAATPTISTDADAAGRPAELSAEVIELARAAARQDAGDPALVGDFGGAEFEDDVAVTVRFDTTDIAYTGWSWCVTVAVVDPDQPTISEVVLLPGPDSLLPPAWLPWSERIRPGDVGPGDLVLPPAQDDPRLAPAYLQSDDPAVEDVAHELGIGRVRVMSRAGRTDTAERWYEGSFGPTADMAKQAPLQCVMCAFFLPLAGSLGARFGVCGNEMSPADGRAVDLGYGCGAHSELVIEPVPSGFRPSHIDDTVLDVHPRGAAIAESAAAFLGEDDSELEIRPSRNADEQAVSAVPAGPAVPAVPAAVRALADEVPAAADAAAPDAGGETEAVMSVVGAEEPSRGVDVQDAPSLEESPVEPAGSGVGSEAGAAARFGGFDVQDAPSLEESPVEPAGSEVGAAEVSADHQIGAVDVQDAPSLEESPVEPVGSGAGSEAGAAEYGAEEQVGPVDVQDAPTVGESPGGTEAGAEGQFAPVDVQDARPTDAGGPAHVGSDDAVAQNGAAEEAGPGPEEPVDAVPADAVPADADPERPPPVDAVFDSNASDGAASDATVNSGEPAPGDADA